MERRRHRCRLYYAAIADGVQACNVGQIVVICTDDAIPSLTASSPMKKPSAAGGWHAIKYTWTKAREVGGAWKLWKAMRSRNACKTCAVGMGGQKGGMVNERGSF